MEEIRYCPMCGAYLPLGRRKCLACGSPIEVPKDESDQNVLETTPLDDDTYTVYVDGVPVKSFRVGEADIDLDKILQKEYYTIKLGGKTEWYYTGKADMTIENTTYHTTDLFGQIARFEDGKKKLHLCLIER